jgi:apolipoprotein N-acyltransferase
VIPQRLDVVARWAQGRWGAALCCLLAGLGAALAHPPFGILPGLLGYGLALHLIDQDKGAPHRLRGGFWRGWLVGLAYFFVSTWWVGEAFLVEIELYGWMAPIAVLSLSGGLALFWGVAALAYRWAVPKQASALVRIAVFVLVFSAVEWLRGHVLTGFAWNLPGETWRAGSAPSQMASVVGAYGLSLITLWIAGSFGLLLRQDQRRQGLVLASLAVAMAAGLYGFGMVRLGSALPPSASGPVVRIVQANIPQSAKWTPENFRNILAKYTALTAHPSKGPVPAVVIWPEGAIPAALDDYLAPGSWTRDAVVASLKPGQVLMVGGYRLGGTFERPVYYNSLLGVRREGEGLKVTGVYDKFRLVPFGEYLPLGEILGRLGIRRLVHAPDDFTPGPRPQPVQFDGLPLVQPLICYESLFPGFTREGAALSGRRAAWILNVSNDAWFGKTSGPWQHLNIASYRAIEEGLPLVRSTPTGISAVIDAYGRRDPSQSLVQGTQGVIDSILPSALAPTVYSRLGDGPFSAMLLIVLIIILVLRRRN